MSELLDYEATKAALRAQTAGSSVARGGISTIAWRWFAAATSLVVVVCAVVTTVWVTSDSPTPSVRMVPSGDHSGASSTSRDIAGTTASATRIPGAPTLLGATAVIRPDGSITGLDAAGNVVTITSPTAEQTEAVLRILRSPGSGAATSIRPVTAAIVPPRGRTSQAGDPPSGGGSVPPPPAPTVPQPTNPPTPPPPAPTEPPAPPAPTTQETVPSPDPTNPPPTHEPSPTTNDPTPDTPSGGDSSGDGNGGDPS